MNSFDRFMLVLGSCGYGALFMVPAVGLVLHSEALDAAPGDIEPAPASGTRGSRACQDTSGRCDAGCHRLNDRRVTRAFARITAGLEPG
ncbi:hypothetical protein [Agromyces allii]|uniref:Uncharacterized protein n=1 Tax=Agromyces allii TaxID=393607 RepID=A0ABN2R9F7_9MICO|nr:hypothetical protein [Agromyces allii]